MDGMTELDVLKHILTEVEMIRYAVVFGVSWYVLETISVMWRREKELTLKIIDNKKD